MTEKKRGSFSGSIGFVLAAAGSAVGLGNIWRFPYLAAKDNGGLFIFCYLILVVTFGFTLLMTEIAIGRKTKQSPLTAYGKINKKFGFLGSLATLVPIIILPYYCAIGGWVFKYFIDFISPLFLNCKMFLAFRISNAGNIFPLYLIMPEEKLQENTHIT